MRSEMIAASMMGLALAASDASAAADTYDARVVSVTPVVTHEMLPRASEHCGDVEVVTQHKHTLGPSIAGALIGAVVGSRFGGGTGRTIATVAGGVVGEKTGEHLAKARQHTVIRKECDPIVEYVPTEVQRYQVTYEIDGEQFQTTMDKKPGATVKLRLKPQ